MTIIYEQSKRMSGVQLSNMSVLEEKFEVIKDIGDGSFGSVSLARVRAAGAHIAKRGTMVAIKTMKKTFDSFASCMELREVIFLRTIPNHIHLVPALDIFLDPTTKKLHICMEHMDGNLYQLMKSRENNYLDGASVKSILFQILAGLDHIHAHNFFHRDIKPENILISNSAPFDSQLKRYSSFITPPSTPPMYSVKLADFGLARETRSKLPYTTYVSTRWYRAPEVLLRAGEYSAPVDMWAIGAMAVEIATLKPLFPGGNEVDQVWRVCEIMGSPGNWCNKSGGKVGGGEWREGTRLAQKLGFSFPKMAPHAMETILQTPRWPLALSHFVTWCLMWDPNNRPTTTEAMNHEYFADDIDPLMRPKSSTSRLLSRKHSSFDPRPSKEVGDSPTLSARTSWFRKSLIGRDSSPIIPQQVSQLVAPPAVPVHSVTLPIVPTLHSKPRPNATKRATWTNGSTPSVGAPMPILPSIRPISPLSNAVTAQATTLNEKLAPSTVQEQPTPEKKKLGRQLSVASHGNHYADPNLAETERALNGRGGVASPTNSQKESFFSHLRKRARRFSGRNQLPNTPKYEDPEPTAGCGPWAASTRSSMILDPKVVAEALPKGDFTELDKALQNVKYSLEATTNGSPLQSHPARHTPTDPAVISAALKRHHSMVHVPSTVATESASPAGVGPISSRTRRALHLSSYPAYRYETPDEEEELLDEALKSASRAVHGLENPQKTYVSRDALVAVKDSNRQALQHSVSVGQLGDAYPTPSPSARRNGILFQQNLMDEPTTPLNIARSRPTKETYAPMFPTPPYEENEWAAAALASTFAAGSAYRY